MMYISYTIASKIQLLFFMKFININPFNTVKATSENFTLSSWIEMKSSLVAKKIKTPLFSMYFRKQEIL